MHQLIRVLAVLLAVPALAYADTPEAAPIATLDNALITTMKAAAAKTSFQSRYDTLAPVVKQVLDMPVILKNSVGVLWMTLPASQQQQLDTLFEQFTVASYVNGFNGYGGERFDVLPSETAVGTRKIVKTQIVPGDGSSPTELDYVMGQDNGDWQVTDVLLNGTISKVAIQASDFASLVNAGDASQLIAALKTKIATLSGGVLKT